MRFVSAPDWGLCWIGDARYYGWRWVAHVGPWLVFLRSCTQSEMDAYHDEMIAEVKARRRTN